MGRVSNMMMFRATIGRSATCWNPRLFGAATPRAINQVPNSNETLSSDGAGTGEKVNAIADENCDSKAYSTAPQIVKEKAREVGAEISAKAENIGEKAKQVMQDAWDSTKHSAQKAADTVLSKVEDSADSLKQHADSLKRSLDDNNNN